MAANPGGPGGKGPPPSNQNRVLPTQVLTISQNVKHNPLCVQVTPSMAAAATPMAGLATSINPGSDLASLFECPVCFDYVLPPILQVSLLSWMMQILCSLTLNPPLSPQCHAGHLVCSNCRPKLTCCPTCRGQLGGNIRNLAMEKVLLVNISLSPLTFSQSGGLHSNVPLQVLQRRLHRLPPPH